ncbi:MAG: hypothetical protein ACRC92_24470 [Peptostreptococcaceae bacterium]
MDQKMVGIIVKNDYDDILFHTNNFFIQIEICKKDDLRVTLEDKLSEILDKKAFRIDKISKKIPKLDLSNKCNNNEYIVMYLVNVYMYSDNSKFLSKEDILDRLSTSLFKDYYVKYIIRYDKYRYLVELYVGMFVYLFCSIGILSFPDEIRTKFLFDTLFYNFWTALVIYIILPAFILNKFIVPSIVNYLVEYDISKKTIKISKLLYGISIVLFFFFLLN